MTEAKDLEQPAAAELVAPKVTNNPYAPEIVAEAITGIAFSNNVAKVNIASSRFNPNGPEPELVTSVHLAIPITSLVGIRDALSQIIAQMEKVGFIASSSPSSGDGVTNTPSPKRRRKSS